MESKDRINAAHRLFVLFKSAVTYGHSSSQFDIWVNVFQLQGLPDRERRRYVGRGIELIHEQLDLLVEQLKANGHSERTYEDLLSFVDSVITYQWIGHPWNDLRPRLEKALYPLEILKSVLPDEERVLDPKELSDLKTALDTLEQSLADKHLSPELRLFVKRQLAIIRGAMWDYKFRGIRTFQQGFAEAMPDLLQNENLAKSESNGNGSVYDEVRSLWKKVSGMVVSAGKVGTGLAGMYKVYEIAEKSGLIHHK